MDFSLGTERNFLFSSYRPSKTLIVSQEKAIPKNPGRDVFSKRARSRNLIRNGPGLYDKSQKKKDDFAYRLGKIGSTKGLVDLRVPYLWIEKCPTALRENG